MISVETALGRLLALLRPLAAEQVALPDAAGRVLAEDLVARRSQPPVALSAMDGYAVRAADVTNVPARLKVVGAAPAGGAYAGTVGASEAVRIFTGAPMPAGADSVVIQEDTDRHGDEVVVREAAQRGRHVRAAGLDFVAGVVGLKAPRRLTPRDVGLAAAMDRPWLMVHRRPRIAILATGDEIVMPGDPIGPNQIVSSNSVALAAFIRACGGEPLQLGIAPDRADALQQAAEGARGADLLVTTGGASVGEHDLVREALGAAGMTLDFWTIAMRPGKPMMVGRYRESVLIGLPGNPVSSLVCALLFLKPAIERLLGLTPITIPTIAARLTRALPANDHRQDYLRARFSRAADGGLQADPFPTQDSSMMSVLTAADGLVVRPPNAAAAAAGDSVSVIPFDSAAPL